MEARQRQVVEAFPWVRAFLDEPPARETLSNASARTELERLTRGRTTQVGAHKAARSLQAVQMVRVRASGGCARGRDRARVVPARPCGAGGQAECEAGAEDAGRPVASRRFIQVCLNQRVGLNERMSRQELGAGGRGACALLARVEDWWQPD